MGSEEVRAATVEKLVSRNRELEARLRATEEERRRLAEENARQRRIIRGLRHIAGTGKGVRDE